MPRCAAGLSEIMSHELICSWLGLPAGSWPPDHYRLLGLEPGEVDTAPIEQRVHQRIDSVRVYQMRYPEQATEAMRPLARALTLTDPAGKKAYDASLGGVTATATVEPPSRADLEARVRWPGCIPAATPRRFAG